MEIRNLKKSPMELMYLAHVNFRPLDGGRLVTPAPATPQAMRVRTLVPGNLSPPPGYRDTTYILRARRPGRTDEVRIGLEGEGPQAKVVSLRATIVVSHKDTWPKSLFTLLGSPREAAYDRWAWWNAQCGAAMLLSRIESLGGSGKTQPYILEIKPYP